VSELDLNRPWVRLLQIFAIGYFSSLVRGEGFELPEGSNIVKNAFGEILNRSRD
jgi:hypothetical protein